MNKVISSQLGLPHHNFSQDQ